MDRHKSALRQERRGLRRNAINSKNKSELRSSIKTLRTAIDNKEDEEAKKLLPQTFSVIDRTSKKGAIHKNTGDRYKSRLSRQVESMNSTETK